MKNIDFKCPKCGCESATRIPIELLDGAKGIWYRLVLLSLFAGSVSPFFIIFSFVCIIIIIVINVLKKIAYKNEWIMQCSSCGTEYTVPNPDREDAIQKAILKKQLKADEKAEYYRIKEKYKQAALAINGVLLIDESLIEEIKDVGYHKNAFITKYGNVKITNKSLIYYNEGGSLRIPKNEILAISPKNYFLIIPTGIQIKTHNRKIKLVVESKTRQELLLKLKQ